MLRAAAGLKRLKGLRWALLAGGGLLAALPHVGLPGLVFVSFVPLLALASRTGPAVAEKVRRTFVLAWVWYAVAVYWLYPIFFLVPALFALVLALYPVAFVLLADRVLRCGGERLFWLFAPACWTLLEWLQGLGPAGFPYIKAAHALVGWPRLVQLAEYTGEAGLTFLVLLANAALALLIRAARRGADRAARGRAAAYAGAAALCWAAVCAQGGGALQRHLPASGGAQVRLGVVQGYCLPQSRFEPTEADVFAALDVYDRLTGGFAPGAVDLVVWPETAVPVMLRGCPDYQQVLEGQGRRLRAELLTGSTDMEAVENGPDRVFNSALRVRAGEGIVQAYDKMHRVPFGEYVPLGDDLWPAAARLVPVPQHLTAGTRMTVFSLPVSGGLMARYSVLICYEDVFAGLARRAAREGAQFLVNLTNDGWFGDTFGPTQHLRAALLRAVETRRYLVRAASTGISCLVDPAGRVCARVERDGRAVCVRGTAVFSLDARLLDPPATFYVRHGDLFGQACGLCVMLILTGCLLKTARRKG